MALDVADEKESVNVGKEKDFGMKCNSICIAVLSAAEEIKLGSEPEPVKWKRPNK